MRGHCAPRGPWEPAALARQPHGHRHITISSKINRPWREEQVISALSLNLPPPSLALFQYPDKWSALSSLWPENTPLSCFFGTATFIFSITAESYFCFLMEPPSRHLFFLLGSKFHFRKLACLLYIRHYNQACYFLTLRVSSTPRLIRSKISHIADT